MDYREIAERMLRDYDAQTPGTIFSEGLRLTVAEAYRLQSATPESIVACVDSVMPVIELHSLVMRGEAPRGHELIANNCIHARVVRGKATGALAGTVSTDLVVLFDGEAVDSWSALRWPDDILQAVPWLVADLAEGGFELRAGTTLFTGAFGPPLALGEKTSVEVVSSAFGSAVAFSA